MKIAQPPREEVEKLIRHSLTMRGTGDSDLVLVGPSLEEVTEAFAAWPKGEVNLLVASSIRFKDVIAGKNRATLQSVMEFKTLTLTRVAEIVATKDGVFSFVGSIREYNHEDFRLHGQFYMRGYMEDHFRVKHDPNLHLHTTYDKFGFGHGTEFEGEEH